MRCVSPVDGITAVTIVTTHKIDYGTKFRHTFIRLTVMKLRNAKVQKHKVSDEQ